jgi:hypothetical protein
LNQLANPLGRFVGDRGRVRREGQRERCRRALDADVTNLAHRQRLAAGVGILEILQGGFDLRDGDGSHEQVILEDGCGARSLKQLPAPR